MGSFISTILVTAINPSIAKATKRSLAQEDLVLQNDRAAAATAFKDFDHFWQDELRIQKSDQKPSLFRAIRRTFGGELLRAAALKLVWGALLVLSASFFVRQLLRWLQDYGAGRITAKDNGWILGVFFFVCCWLLSVSLQQMNRISSTLGIRVRAALATSVYRKSLTIDMNAKKADALSLVSTDCTKLMEAASSINFLWSGVAESLAIIGVLIGFVGVSALPGLGLLLILLPLQYYIGLLAAKQRKRTIEASDQRVSLMDEVLRSVKLVKCYAWETSFADLVAKFRKSETDIQTFGGIIKSINLTLVFALPPMIALIIFGVLSVNGDLDPIVAFTTLSLFNTLRLPLVILPKCLRATAEAASSLTRLESYLLSPDRQVTARLDKPGISLQAATFTYGDASNKPLLRGFSLDVKPGQLIMVCGPVGCGKSNFLHALLGNMTLTKGSSRIGGKFAYVPQTPWCQFGTVRDNILFGQPWDEARYRAVVHACSLTADLEIMEQGDLTAIGERGVNISGGQKARIALARAAYSQADIFLLDSPLAAVDNFVAAHIFTYLFKTWLKGKTIVLVTHAVDLLHNADQVLVLKDGAPAYTGPFNHAILRQHFGNVITATPDTDSALEQAVTAATAASDDDNRIRRNTSGNAANLALQLHRGTSDESDTAPGSARRGRARSSMHAFTVDNEHEATLKRAFSKRAEHLAALANEEDGTPAVAFAPPQGGILPMVLEEEAAAKTPRAGGSSATTANAESGSGDASPSGSVQSSSSMVAVAPGDTSAALVTVVVPTPSPAASPAAKQSTAVSSSSGPSIASPEQVGVVVKHAPPITPQSRSRVASVTAAPPSSRKSISVLVPAPSTTAANAPSKQAGGAAAGTAGTSAAPAFGVPATTDPTRPARPERKEQGFNGYHVLFSNVGYGLLLLSLFVFIATQLTRIFSDIWISAWSANKYKQPETWYVLNYLGYVLLFMVLLYFRGFIFYTFFRAGASRMHNSMFTAILRAPLSWFTVTPVGRVLSAFSLDQDNLDEALPDAIMMVTIYVMILGTTMGVVIRVLPFFAIVTGVLAISFAYFFWLYISASRVMKNASGAALSLVVAHVSETLQGIAVIRAYDAEERFAQDNLQRLHALQVSSSNLDLLQVWLQFRLDTIGSLLVLGVSLLCVGLSDTLTPSSAGLAISNAFQILLFFSLMVRGCSEIDSNIASAERVQQLAMVQPEADKPLTFESCPHPAWPSRGEIAFSNVHMSYGPNLPRVLKGVSFSIRPSEKVAVVGRTGAGKSSLIMALFRLSDLAEGSISIDGIDTASLVLKELRSRISILPQEPSLFNGTLRSNLDPFGRYSDEELLAVARKCYLGDLIAADPAGLGLRIAPNGANMSLGTAQLVCLARALLNKSRILVLDEATAALDLETDRAVQKVIRTEFAERTIITIAHRLDTIIDSDSVLVMNAGQVAEFDAPYNLLQKEDSIFSNLCRQAGPGQYELLLNAAAQHQRTIAALQAEVADEIDAAEEAALAEVGAVATGDNTGTGVTAVPVAAH